MNDLPDTIFYPDAFRRSKAAGFDGVFDWSWMDGCFGDTGIMPMDFDCVVERKAQFLIVESKDIGVPIPYGQLRSLQAIHNKRCACIMFVYGKREPEHCVCWLPGSKQTEELIGVDEATAFVARWFAWVEENF